MKYSQLKNVKEQLNQCADKLALSSDHPALLAAEETGDDLVLKVVASALAEADVAIQGALSNLDALAEKSASFLTEEDIDDLAELLASYEESEDPSLKKKADVLEQLLINFAQKGELEKSKRAQQDELDRLREKYKHVGYELAYEKKDEGEEKMKADAGNAIKEQLERKRPLEAPLNTRYCPDHNGTGVIRIGEGVYQCPLDKKLYNYQEGYTTTRGDQVPGGTVSRQTQNLGQRRLEQTNFSTREGKLNSQ